MHKMCGVLVNLQSPIIKSEIINKQNIIDAKDDESDTDSSIDL